MKLDQFNRRGTEDVPTYQTASTSFSPVVTTILKKDLLEYCDKYIAANTHTDKESYREQVVLNGYNTQVLYLENRKIYLRVI